MSEPEQHGGVMITQRRLEIARTLLLGGAVAIMAWHGPELLSAMEAAL